MRKIYEKPLAEVIELRAMDIITASLDMTISGKGYAISGESDYTTYYNKSAGNKLTLK